MKRNVTLNFVFFTYYCTIISVAMWAVGRACLFVCAMTVQENYYVRRYRAERQQKLVAAAEKAQ